MEVDVSLNLGVDFRISTAGLHSLIGRVSRLFDKCSGLSTNKFDAPLSQHNLIDLLSFILKLLHGFDVDRV